MFLAVSVEEEAIEPTCARRADARFLRFTSIPNSDPFSLFVVVFLFLLDSFRPKDSVDRSRWDEHSDCYWQYR